MSPRENNPPKSSFSSPANAPLPTPKQESRPFRLWPRLRRGLIRGIGIGIAAFFVANLWTSWLLNRELNAIRQRGETLRFVDLAPPKLPDSENAALVYLQAADALKLTKTEEEALQNNSYVQPDPVLLVNNAKAIELTRHAAEIHACRFPVDYEATNLAGILLRHLAKMRQLSHVLRAKALHEARAGQTQAALDDVSTLFRMSEHLAPEPILLSTLSSVAIEMVGYRTLAHVLDFVTLTPQQAQEFAQRLPHTDWVATLNHVLQGERCFGLWAFQYVSNPIEACQMMDGRPHPNIITRSLGVLWAPLWKLDELHYLHARDMQAEAIRIPGTTMLSGDAVERSLPWYAVCTKIMLPDLSRVGRKRDEVMVYRSMAQVALALNAYRSVRASEPASLSEAEALWNAPLPQDLYSGQPFQYRAAGGTYLLYSIGPNHKDDRGDKAVWNNTSVSDREASRAVEQGRKDAPDDLVWWN